MTEHQRVASNSLDASLEVTWDDGTVTRYPWIWLRDHAHDADTLHPVTQQRQLFTAALRPTSSAQQTSRSMASRVRSRGTTAASASVLPVSFLARYRARRRPPEPPSTRTITLWDAAIDRAPTCRPFRTTT